MIKSILKYAGKYKIFTIVATIMVAIAVAAQILPYIFAYQIISPLIAGDRSCRTYLRIRSSRRSLRARA